MENTVYLFAELPTEILLQIFDNLNRVQLANLTRVNRKIRPLAQYTLEHRKKIRLCGDILKVLVFSPPSLRDEVGAASRSHLLSLAMTNQVPNSRARDWRKDHARRKIISYGDPNEKKIVMIEAPNEIKYRKQFYINAIAADLCLLIVDPREIDEYTEYIKEAIFGCCFMMSARNVIVAIDLRDQSSVPALLSAANRAFTEAKSKISKLLDRTVGMCYKIVPIDISTGCNISTKQSGPIFKWWSGPSVKELLIADQLRTNFDELEYKKLCEEPLKFQFMFRNKVRGVGSVVSGLVLSGTVKPFDALKFHPGDWTLNAKCFETYGQPLAVAKPGDVVGINIPAINYHIYWDISTRVTYLVNAKTTQTVNCTMAFRAQIAILKPNSIALHQAYNIFYGAARIRCLLWWIFPTDGNNHTKAERKLTEEGQVRPPRQTFKKATVIFVPVIHYDIETYKPSAFEKNYRGKVMIVEKNLIVGVGRVDRVISVAAPTFKAKLVKKDFYSQYETIQAKASSLFDLPKENLLLYLFEQHIRHEDGPYNSMFKVDFPKEKGSVF